MPDLPITLAVSIVPVGLSRAIAASLALVVGIGVLLACRAAVWQTTLKSGWWWSLAALTAWSAVEVTAGLNPPAAAASTFAAVRLAAMSLSLCPAVALLGAKRPQNQAWNFVVLSLWGILILPAAETLWLHPGQRISFGVVRSWFLWIPIALALLNYGGTRFWLAAFLLVGGQTIAFSPYLPLAPASLITDGGLAGLVLAAAALPAALLAARSSKAAGHELDPLWFDFRDTLGAFWALRVQERMNAAAQQYGWNIELFWTGFRPRGDSEGLPIAQGEPSPLATFKGLLRRFVSRKWIEQRLAATDPAGQAE